MAVKVSWITFQFYFMLLCMYYFHSFPVTTADLKITKAVDEVYELRSINYILSEIFLYSHFVTFTKLALDIWIW